MHSVLAGLTLLGGKLLSNIPERIFFSPRVNLFKLGGKVQQGQVQVPALGLVQNFEDWQVCYNMFFSVKKRNKCMFSSVTQTLEAFFSQPRARR